MKNQKNKENLTTQEQRILPFFVEFVKFSTVFVVIIAIALITLRVTSAAMP